MQCVLLLIFYTTTKIFFSKGYTLAITAPGNPYIAKEPQSCHDCPAEETEVQKCPVAKGLYGFCCTYRFVASVYLQADVLPHLARLSKIFQKEMVNFLAIK